MSPRAWSFLSSLLLAAQVAPAAAQDLRPHAPLPGYDGVYGRLDGSVTLSLAAGAALEAGEPRAALRAAGHYLWTAGGYVRYEDGLGGNDRRALGLGIDLRPLFLPRFALDAEHGPALLDLTLDSLSLNAGAYFAQPVAAGFGDERGFDLGLGVGVPLLSQAEGPWLEARAERRFADRGDGAWLFTVAASYHTLILSTDSER
jgi:hypothetical protein